jgi:hypothetical protein
LKLPEVFQAPQEPVVGRSLAPYVVFAHPKRSDEWAKLQSQFGVVTEGEMYLVEPERATHLQMAKLGWLVGRQFWADANAAGEVQTVSWKEMPRPYKEHVESVVLVYLAERIVPANMLWRSTKCPAAKMLSDALTAAIQPTWGERSPQHKETLVCNQPFMRFYGEVALGPQRTSKSSGMPYRTSTCAVKPTGVSEWRLLKVLCEDASTQKALDDAALRFQTRINEMQAKVK